MRKAFLKTRWNKDGTIVLLSRGRVVFKTKNYSDIKYFKEGWYGEVPDASKLEGAPCRQESH